MNTKVIHIHKGGTVEESIGKRIRALRELKGVSVGELAVKSEVSKGTISLAERDITMLASDSMGRLCRILGVTTDSIIYGQRVFSSDEWDQLSSTKKGEELKQIVLNLHKNGKLTDLLSILNYLNNEQVDLLFTMAKSMRDQIAKRSDTAHS